MALNWVMLDNQLQRPLPLPTETLFFSASQVDLTLEFAQQQNVNFKAIGNTHVTSHRIVFVRQPHPVLAAGEEPPPGMLLSLSVPMDHLQSYKYVIPIFSAAYLEADIIPVPEGGLPQCEVGQPASIGKLKLWFNEGGGIQFRDTVEKSKKAWEERKQDEETLPAYEPSPPFQ